MSCIRIRKTLHSYKQDEGDDPLGLDLPPGVGSPKFKGPRNEYKMK